jgi:hypothetical protein
MVVTLSGILAFVDLRAMEALGVGRDEHTMVACLQRPVVTDALHGPRRKRGTAPCHWSQQWRETPARDLSGRIPIIVRELEKATSVQTRAM